jgi:hypothetical protein
MQAAEDNNGRSMARKKNREAQAREGVERLTAAGIALSDDEAMERPQASSWQESPLPLPMSRLTAAAASAAAAAGTAGRVVVSGIRSSAGLLAEAKQSPNQATEPQHSFRSDLSTA